MFDWIGNIFTYPIFSWTETVEENGEVITNTLFTFSVINIIMIIVIYLLAKIFIKYSKRYFKAWELTDKQVKIEGKEIAVWRLFKQFVYLLTFYFCFLSLKLNNPSVNLSNILGYEFFRIQHFHLAVYHLFLIAAVLFIARISVNFLKVFLLKTVRKNDRIDTGTEYIYVQLAKYLVYTIAIIILLRSLGMDLDLFLTATTFLLVGVGLGLQAIFQDYFSGILLLLEGVIKVGDVVEIESLQGKENFVATIVQINLRTSKVETRNGKVLIIPNSKLTQESVINWSAGNHVNRFSIPITFEFGVDTDLVKEILIECVQEHPGVIKTRKPLVRLLNFGNYGLEMDVVFWAEQNMYIEIIKSDIRFSIDRELRARNIQVPYPKADVNFREVQD